MPTVSRSVNPTEHGAGNIYVEFKKIDSQSLPTIYTKGRAANGIYAINKADGEGEIRVVVNNAKIDTEGREAHGVHAYRENVNNGYGKVYIDIVRFRDHDKRLISLYLSI